MSNGTGPFRYCPNSEGYVAEKSDLNKGQQQEKPNMQTPAGHQAPGGRVNPPPPATGPMRVLFNGDLLEVSAVLADAEAVDRLVKALQANKALLPDKKQKDDEAAN